MAIMDADELDEILKAVRGFIREQVIPREDEIEDTDEIPAQIRDQAAAMGLFGYALPAEYGGLGLRMSEDVRLALEFGYTSPAFRSMFGTNNGIAGQVIAKFGTDTQKRDFLPGLAAGELIASFALTEAEAGSDPSGLRTTARHDEDHYVLNGQKRFITNAPEADIFVVFARTDPNSKGGKGISAFIVDAGTVAIGPSDKKMGQAGAHTAEVYLDNVRVPETRLIGGVEGEAYAWAMAVLARGRVHIAALCVGLAQRVQDESVRHAATSKQGDRIIGDHQLVQALLADSQVEIHAGRALVLDVAARYDSEVDTVVGPSSAKLFCSEMLGRVADRGVQVHGGLGYMRSVAVERFYRDARLFRIYEGTSEIQRIVIGRALVRGVR
jgi:acyl-CoA dehydrogenase